MVHSSNSGSVRARAAARPPQKTAPTTGTRLERRAQDRRLGILRAAANVFRERGYADAGMRDIAVAADLSPGNLYHYFRGKDEILFFCQSRALDRLLEGLAAARKDPRAFPTRMRTLAVLHVLCLLDEVEGSAAHLEVDSLPPSHRAAVIAKRDRYERGVRALIVEGVRRGKLRAADATVATRAFLGALNWTAQWYRPGGQLDSRAIADRVADYAVGGLLRNTEREGSAERRRSPKGSRSV